MAQRYFIETYGCQMNVHDSERMAGLLESAGYEPACDQDDADVIVINTCSVRERAEEKLYTRLGELRESGTHARRPIVAVTGCVAQQDGASILRRAPFVDVVLGTQQIKRLPMLIEQAATRAISRPLVDISPHDDVSFPLGVVRRSDPVKAYVTIIEGCNEFCSFCVVPYTRGHERMRPKRDILDEVRAAADAGRPEIQLLGQIVNHYQAPDDPACDFAALLEAVHEVPGVRRIRFASPHPRHVTHRLIAAMHDLPKVCRHLHLPVQSGSTRVLATMRRRHTRADYLKLVDTLREALPEIALSTDMIVGFPGETERDFAETLSLVERVRYHSMFSFKYSARPNTLAQQRMPDEVSDEIKTQRIVELQARQRAIQLELHAAAVGTDEEVLVDSTSRRRDWEVSGRTSGNTVVNFRGSADWVGSFIRVRITHGGPNSLSGERLVHAHA
jgi:tRNA-2-methylthio-N6-dimethylallyladenosine synthase